MKFLVYTLELEQVSHERIWAYRKAAWTIEDLDQDISLVYAQMGIKGLAGIPDISLKLAVEIEQLLQQVS